MRCRCFINLKTILFLCNGKGHFPFPFFLLFLRLSDICKDLQKSGPQGSPKIQRFLEVPYQGQPGYPERSPEKSSQRSPEIPSNIQLPGEGFLGRTKKANRPPLSWELCTTCNQCVLSLFFFPFLRDFLVDLWASLVDLWRSLEIIRKRRKTKDKHCHYLLVNIQKTMENHNF